MKFHELVLAAARTAHPIKGAPDAWRRARFVARAIRQRRLIRSWLDLGDTGGMRASLAERPQMIGVIEWPYLNKDWEAPARFDCIRGHYTELEALPWMRMGLNETRVVAELGDLVPGLRIVLDRPLWFLREGELTLNLFIEDTRVYSLAFALGRRDGRRAAFIGAMQGRNLENIEAIYKDLTKKLHGARPRDFLSTVFQMLCGAAAVERLFGVSESCRHHRHPYFGNKAEKTQSTGYDEIWADRGGVASDGGFFELPVAPVVRSDQDIPSHKRSMYRKRYALYDRVRGDVERMAGLPSTLPIDPSKPRAEPVARPSAAGPS